MKQTCIKMFSFRPEDYHSMEHYLNKMLEDGWRLRWCKGTLAGFERTDNKYLRYIVDPYPMASIMNLKKFPKFRLNKYMENGWYAAGKSRGCYIFCTDNPSAEIPDLEDDIAVSAQKTCLMGSLILAVLLLTILFKSIFTPAILYNILLTDIYIVLTGLVVFLILYNLINAILLSAPLPKGPMTNLKICKRYIIHDMVLFISLLLAILLQATHYSSMLSYLILPIIVIIIGSIILIAISKQANTAHESNKRLIPLICIMGLLLLILIPLSVHRLQENSKADSQTRQKELLAHSNNLAVAHLSDFISVPGSINAIRENNSILGNNILYAEEFQNLDIFTNRTEMKSTSLAKVIFNYLFTQAQLEHSQQFQHNDLNGVIYYSLKNSNTVLFQRNNVVYLCTAPYNVDDEEVMELLLSY
ncbi:hypothetical protein DP68_15470 [Clostridium sp. HMP27]|nr:hypothetical protein DP68_15470 [Clostridium sp. HMP27]